LDCSPSRLQSSSSLLHVLSNLSRSYPKCLSANKLLTHCCLPPASRTIYLEFKKSVRVYWYLINSVSSNHAQARTLLLWDWPTWTVWRKGPSVEQALQVQGGRSCLVSLESNKICNGTAVGLGVQLGLSFQSWGCCWNMVCSPRGLQPPSVHTKPAATITKPLGRAGSRAGGALQWCGDTTPRSHGRPAHPVPHSPTGRITTVSTAQTGSVR
jgi:hypothetical protein